MRVESIRSLTVNVGLPATTRKLSTFCKYNIIRVDYYFVICFDNSAVLHHWTYGRALPRTNPAELLGVQVLARPLQGELPSLRRPERAQRQGCIRTSTIIVCVDRRLG